MVGEGDREETQADLQLTLQWPLSLCSLELSSPRLCPDAPSAQSYLHVKLLHQPGSEPKQVGKGQGGAWLPSLAVSNYCDPPVRHFPTEDRSKAVLPCQDLSSPRY